MNPEHEIIAEYAAKLVWKNFREVVWGLVIVAFISSLIYAVGYTIYTTGYNKGYNDGHFDGWAENMNTKPSITVSVASSTGAGGAGYGGNYAAEGYAGGDEANTILHGENVYVPGGMSGGGLGPSSMVTCTLNK